MRAQPMPQSALQTRAHGFTLIELLVTISIAAVLAAIAAPSFSSFIAGQRIKTASYDVSYALTYARSEAIKRNADVVLAPASGGWQNGWTVSAGAVTLQQHDALTDMNVTGPTPSLTYNSNGRLKVAVTSFAISSISTSASPRCVSIDLSGLPNSKTGVC